MKDQGSKVWKRESAECKEEQSVTVPKGVYEVSEGDKPLGGEKDTTR